VWCSGGGGSGGVGSGDGSGSGGAPHVAGEDCARYEGNTHTNDLLFEVCARAPPAAEEGLARREEDVTTCGATKAGVRRHELGKD
jgi:hypothetical protein